MSSADEIVGMLGEAGAEKLASALKDIKADSPWEKLAVDITVDFVEEHGIKGIDMAWDAIKDSMEGKVPDLSGLSIRASSDLVAKLQSEEFKDKDAVEDWFAKVGQAIGPVVSAALASALS